MKSKLMVIGITFLLIMASAVTCFAVDGPALMIKASPKEVEAGETFEVTINAQSELGINGLISTYSYDETKLELVSSTVAENFANLGSGKEIALICNTEEKVTQVDLYVMTFRVKEGVEPGTEIRISISDTEIDTDSEENSTFTYGEMGVTIKVKGEQEQECQHIYGNYVDNGDGKHTGTCTVCNTQITEEHTYENGACSDCNATQPVVPQPTPTPEPTPEPTPQPTPADPSVANKVIPNAGVTTMLAFGIVVITLFAIVMYRKNKKYEDIK